MDRIAAVQRMQSYIEEHINDDISLTDLAEVALFSPWYSARIFKELTKMSPGDYIRKLKLSKSALRLRDEKVKIIDIAYNVGFNSVDGYQRAFQREFGCNPKEYARNPKPLQLFTPYGVKFQALWKEEKVVMKNINNIFIQIIEKPARKVIIKRGVKAKNYAEYCAEVGCDIWGLLMSFKSISGEPVCLWLPSKYRKPNTSEYVQGVEVQLDYQGDIPEGFDIITLPHTKYLMFQGEPFPEEEYCVAIENVQTAIDKYNPEFIGYRWDDDNPQIQLEPIGSRGYIELRAIKSIL